MTPLFFGYELAHSHYVTRKHDAVAYICSSYVADYVADSYVAGLLHNAQYTIHCAASLHDIRISQRANPVQNGSTCIVAGDATSLRDIRISQRVKPVQIGSTCIVAGDAASLCDIGISQRANPVQNGSTCIVPGDAAGRACTSVAKHKSLHQRGAAGRACRSVSQHKSLHKHAMQKS